MVYVCCSCNHEDVMINLYPWADMHTVVAERFVWHSCAMVSYIIIVWFTVCGASERLPGMVGGQVVVVPTSSKL